MGQTYDVLGDGVIKNDVNTIISRSKQSYHTDTTHNSRTCYMFILHLPTDMTLPNGVVFIADGWEIFHQFYHNPCGFKGGRMISITDND